MLKFCSQIFEAGERYRHLGAIVSDARQRAEAEHSAIMEAAINRRKDEAISLLAAHYSEDPQAPARRHGMRLRHRADERARAVPSPVVHQAEDITSYWCSISSCVLFKRGPRTGLYLPAPFRSEPAPCELRPNIPRIVPNPRSAKARLAWAVDPKLHRENLANPD